MKLFKKVLAAALAGVLALWGVWKASRNKKDGHA